MSEPLSLRSYRESVKNIPAPDYQLSANKTEAPSKLLKGGVSLVEKLTEISFNSLTQLGHKRFIEINPNVQLYLVNDKSYINSTAKAVFPIDEPKFTGRGFIFLGRYMWEKDGVSIIDAKIRRAQLYFLQRDNPENGYVVEVKDSLKREERFYALYKLTDKSCDLIQFGTNKRGWFNPNKDYIKRHDIESITFEEEESSYYLGIRYPISQSLIFALQDYNYLNRQLQKLGIEFTDSWAPDPSRPQLSP